MGIGKRLKEAREKSGLTQEELARKIGVTGSAITNYEKETSHPKEPVMYALMDQYATLLTRCNETGSRL